MARAPFNVLVFLYRKNENTPIQYAIFERADRGFWQPVAGGGEDEETPLQTARRETLEETGLDLGDALFRLQSVDSVPVTEFSESWRWGEDLYVIPQYCFAAQVESGEIRISHEHTRYRWMDFAEADRLLKYEGDRTALWELNQRLRGLGPRG